MLLLLLSYYAIQLKDLTLPETIQDVESVSGFPLGSVVQN